LKIGLKLCFFIVNHLSMSALQFLLDQSFVHIDMNIVAAKMIDSIKLTEPDFVTPPENRMVIKQVL